MRESEEITTEKIKAYEFVLKDIDAEVIDRAMAILAQVSVWFPTAAEVRSECGRVVEKMRKELENARFEHRVQLEEEIKAERFDRQATREELQAEFQDMLTTAKLKTFHTPHGPMTDEQTARRLHELALQAKQLGVERKVVL